MLLFQQQIGCLDQDNGRPILFVLRLMSLNQRNYSIKGGGVINIL